jgi:adenylate cyclase class IV
MPPPPPPPAKDADEVEVKLRLPDAAAAKAAAQAILDPGARHAGSRVGRTLAQENVFFDGAGGELGAQRCVLRLRFAEASVADGEGAQEKAESAVLTLKGQQVLSAGIGVARELEAPLPDARAARRYVQDPSLMVQEVLREGKGGEAAAQVLKELDGTEHGRAALASLSCLGGFKNTRREVAWEFWSSGEGTDDAAAREHALVELDETAYEWGTVYELEAEAPGAAAAERLRDALEAALKERGVAFSRSTVSKFRNFIRRELE